MGSHLVDVEALAQRFHETYTRLAPDFGYDGQASWCDLPEQDRQLMLAVCAELAEQFVIVANLAPVIKRLDRIERGVKSLKEQIMSDTSALGTELDGIEGDLTTEQAELKQVLADLEAKEAAGSITAEEQARLEAIRAGIQADTEELAAADAPPAPAPVDVPPAPAE